MGLRPQKSSTKCKPEIVKHLNGGFIVYDGVSGLFLNINLWMTLEALGLICSLTHSDCN